MTRARAMWIVLALAALWPIGQHALVRARHVSRWELGAYGMYSTPDLDVEVEVFTGEGASVRPVREQAEALGHASRLLGTLASPEPLGRAILARDHPLEEVWIVRRWRSLAPDGRVHTHERRDRITR